MDTNLSAHRLISLLFVEDDEYVLELQSSILAMKFHAVMLFTASNGRLGLELFTAHMPDIVITDINMSEMCGVEMCENIRVHKPDTKLIAITGQNSDEIGSVFDHVIIKPVDISELFSVVEQCISGITTV